MVRVEVVFVVLDEVPGDSFAVVWGKELGGRVPELAQIVGLLVIEGVFESGVTVAELLEEGVFGGKGGEVEGVAGREDHDLLGEVAVVWVV